MSYEPKKKKGFLQKALLTTVASIAIGTTAIAMPQSAQANWFTDALESGAKKALNSKGNEILSNIAGGATNIAGDQCKNLIGENAISSSFCSEIKGEAGRQSQKAVNKNKL